MRRVELSLIVVVWMLGVGGCAPSAEESAAIVAKENAKPGYAVVENAEAIRAQGEDRRDPDRMRREYYQKELDRRDRMLKKSQGVSPEKETDAERWWRELWDGS